MRERESVRERTRYKNGYKKRHLKIWITAGAYHLRRYRIYGANLTLSKNALTLT